MDQQSGYLRALLPQANCQDPFLALPLTSGGTLVKLALSPTPPLQNWVGRIGNPARWKLVSQQLVNKTQSLAKCQKYILCFWKNMSLVNMSSLQRILSKKKKKWSSSLLYFATKSQSWQYLIHSQYRCLSEHQFCAESLSWSAQALLPVTQLLLQEKSSQEPAHAPHAGNKAELGPSASNQHRSSSMRFNCLFIILAHRGYKEAWRFRAHHPTEPWELSGLKSNKRNEKGACLEQNGSRCPWRNERVPIKTCGRSTLFALPFPILFVQGGEGHKEMRIWTHSPWVHQCPFSAGLYT